MTLAFAPERIEQWPLARLQRGCAQGDRAALFVVPPDSVEVAGRNFLDQSELQEALADIADSAALEVGCHGKDRAVVARTCSCKNDGLGVGQLDLGHHRLRIGARGMQALLRGRAPQGGAGAMAGLVTRRVRLP